ncbi:leishmanolysin-related zinc metalloendopeptidase [Thermodesulfobacteriota bacterium]
MGTVETYFSKADAKIALELAATSSPFNIEMRFLGGLTPSQTDVFKEAADRWSKVVVGDLPTVKWKDDVIDDLLILVEGQDIDGEGGILGQAGPVKLRPAQAGSSAYIPVVGEITLDTADLALMEQKGILLDVVTHEIGHILGFSSYIWNYKDLADLQDQANPTFLGKAAKKEWGELKGTNVDTPVPLEAGGGPGTRFSHWRDTLFVNELMTGWVSPSPNPLSRLTVASLQDIGHTVNLEEAERYALPNLMEMAESGALAEPERLLDMRMLLPNIPTVLPPETLI